MGPGVTAVLLFIGGPEMTAPELISSSILGSRSDKPDQFDNTTTDFQNTLQTLGLTWFGGGLRTITGYHESLCLGRDPW